MAERWSRKQVADRLGVSIPTVRRLEGKVLLPIQDERGRHTFAPSEVEKLAVRRSAAAARRKPNPDAGEIAARAFELFEQNVTLHECVKQLRQTPDTVYDLWEKWRRGNFEDWQLYRRDLEQHEQDEELDRQLQRNQDRIMDFTARMTKPPKP